MHVTRTSGLSLAAGLLQERGALPAYAQLQAEHLIGAGVMLTGGCSQIRGIRGIAESVFGMPVHLTRAQAVSGPTSAYENPQFSTCIGLAKYAQAVRSEMPESSFLKGFLGNFFKKISPFSSRR